MYTMSASISRLTVKHHIAKVPSPLTKCMYHMKSKLSKKIKKVVFPSTQSKHVFYIDTVKLAWVKQIVSCTHYHSVWFTQATVKLLLIGTSCSYSPCPGAHRAMSPRRPPLWVCQQTSRWSYWCRPAWWCPSPHTLKQAHTHRQGYHWAKSFNWQRIFI